MVWDQYSRYFKKCGDCLPVYDTLCYYIMVVWLPTSKVRGHVIVVVGDVNDNDYTGALIVRLAMSDIDPHQGSCPIDCVFCDI